MPNYENSFVVKTSKRFKIAIASPYPLIRYGVIQILTKKDDRIQAEEFSTVKEICQRIDDSARFDVIILDTGVSDFDSRGSRINKLTYDNKVILLSPKPQKKLLSQAKNCGVSGLMALTNSCNKISSAIFQIAQGQPTWASINNIKIEDEPLNSTPFETLTGAQLRVVNLIVKGLSNRSIANELGIRESTVKLHVTNVFRSTNIRTRTELIIRWFKHKEEARLSVHG